MLKFSLTALKALPKLFAYRNEIDVYTEDKIPDKEFYKALFNRLSGGAKINDVTPLGCKANVLAEYDRQPKKNNRRKLFIVDGDLDVLLETNRKAENNLIILDSYCIENYLIDETAAVELIYFSNGNQSRDQIKAIFNFDKWLAQNAVVLIDLFRHFALLKKFGGGPEICNANEFLTNVQKQTVLDLEKTQAYTNAVKAEIKECLRRQIDVDVEKVYNEALKEITEKWPSNSQTLLRVVSGKSYLLPLMQFRMNHCIGKGKGLFPKTSLKLFLASNIDISRLEFLRQALS